MLLNIASESNPAFCPNACGHSYKGTAYRAQKKSQKTYDLLV